MEDQQTEGCEILELFDSGYIEWLAEREEDFQAYIEGMTDDHIMRGL